MKKINSVLISSLFIGVSILLAVPQEQQEISSSRRNAITAAIEKVSPAVAGINVTAIEEYVASPFFNDPLWSLLFPEQIYRRRVKSIGSGVVISSDGYIVTNTHVVEGAEEIVVTLMGGKEYKAKLVGIDNISDIALLKIDGKSFTYAKLGSSEDVIIGEWVIALGNPFGLFSVNYKPTATIGIVSGTDLDFGPQPSGRLYQDMIQTDAAINTGNSGGPLVNALGEVIGINTFIFTGGQFSEGSIGIGFAIPVDRVKAVVANLKQYGKDSRTFKIGWELQNVDSFLASYLNLPPNTGVIVTRVEKSTPAERSGLKVGDVIISINGKKVARAEEIYAYIQENLLRQGDKIKVRFLRGNREYETQLVLE